MIALLRKIAAIVACSCARSRSFVRATAAQLQSEIGNTGAADSNPGDFELVLANAWRATKGNLIRDLKKEDFTLFEDGKNKRFRLRF
jgi:hypothetical protein